MDATTEKLVDYTLALRFEELADDTVSACKQRILDTLGCVASAHNHPVSIAVRKLAGRYTMDTPATILGGPSGVAPEMAAFANGVMLRLLDLSDTYRGQSGGHPSDVIAGVLAAAELGKRDGKSLITAVATAYEIYCSCCDGVNLNARGWDQPVYGVVSVALAAGQLTGLDREQLGHAVALALTPNMAMFQTRQGELSNWKGCAGANASRNGLFAAILAQSGFTGPPEPIEGKFGLWENAEQFDWPVVVGTPPRHIAGTDLKCFPVCYHGQSSVWAALDMHDQFKVDDIEEITVDTYAVAKGMMANAPSRWAPQTAESADHSLPYVVSLALVDGGISLDAFGAERLQDPQLGALMKKISVNAADDMTALFPDAAPSRITVRLKNGTVVQNETRYPKGHHGAPMTGNEVEDKFRGLFGTYRGAAQANTMIELIAQLDTRDDIGEIFTAFA